MRLIDENDVYALFEPSGKANLHVGDIDVLPRVDAVPVCRCKDCKHMEEWEKDMCMCNHGRTVQIFQNASTSHRSMEQKGNGGINGHIKH